MPAAIQEPKTAAAIVSTSGSPARLVPAETAPAATDPGLPPPKKKRPRRHYSGFRHSPVRVKDLARLLPRRVPRLRDLRIYEAVVYEQMSQYDAAQVFDITQPRVCQILQEVRAWLSTVSWEFPGMTAEQQMNLATHETRRWLEVIHKKALASHAKADANLETVRKIDDQRGHVRTERTSRSHPPTPGFLKLAFQAVVKSGELAGAGQQWLANGEPSTAGGPPSTIEGSATIPDGKPAISALPDPLRLRLTSCPASDLRPEPPVASEAENLLQENRARFSLVSGKANGHKTSLPENRAQSEKSRRRQERENAYRQAADRQGICDEGRKYFYQLLRQLDGLAQRVENQLQRRNRIEARKFHRTWSPSHAADFRENSLRELLRLDRSICTFPYGDNWVLDQYDVTTGRFRWWQNGPPATPNQAAPSAERPKPPPAATSESQAGPEKDAD